MDEKKGREILSEFKGVVIKETLEDWRFTVNPTTKFKISFIISSQHREKMFL